MFQDIKKRYINICKEPGNENLNKLWINELELKFFEEHIKKTFSNTKEINIVSITKKVTNIFEISKKGKKDTKT